MAWKLEIHFSDGSSELVEEDFETEQDAQDGYDSWLENWNAGREKLYDLSRTLDEIRPAYSHVESC